MICILWCVCFMMMIIFFWVSSPYRLIESTRHQIQKNIIIFTTVKTSYLTCLFCICFADRIWKNIYYGHWLWCGSPARAGWNHSKGNTSPLPRNSEPCKPGSGNWPASSRIQNSRTVYGTIQWRRYWFIWSFKGTVCSKGQYKEVCWSFKQSMLGDC